MQKISLLLLLTFSLLSFQIRNSFAQDLVITDNRILEDTTILLSGNLIVKAGGSLTLKKVELKMNCAFNGEYRIEVQPEGALYIYENSIITASNTDNRFAFAVHGKEFEMRSSELHGAGWGDEDEMNNDYNLVMAGTKGLVVTTNNAIIDSNIFSFNHAGLIIADSGAVISNNQFFEQNTQSLFVRDAKSLVVSGNYILNARGSGAIQITSNFNSRYVNNEIISNHGHGIATGSLHNSVIEKNKIRSELISINMLGGGNFNIISDNDILSNEVAFVIWGWGNEIRNNTISSYWGWMGTGIFMVYSYNCIVEDNTFTDVNEENGIWLKHSSNNLIKNNTLVAKKELPGGRSSGILLFNSSKHNLIQGNDITGFHRGISICSSSDHSILYDNTVSSSHYWGLIITNADSNFIYSNNDFSNNPIPLYNEGTNFLDYQGDLPEWKTAEVPEFSEYYDDYVTGIQVIENQTFELGNFIITEGGSLTIRNSTVIIGKKGTSGLWVHSGGMLNIYNSKFLMYEYGAGFELHPCNGSKFVMTDSEINGAGFEWWIAGLYLSTDSMIIERNRISGITINFSYCKNIIFRDNILSNMHVGVNLYKDVSHILIENNLFDGAFRAGIIGTGDNITIRNNKFKDIWGSGINLWMGFNNVIENDTFCCVREPFPAINAGEDNTEIHDNVIYDSYNGIMSGGSGSRLTGNKILNCNHGIEISSDEFLSTNFIRQCILGIRIRNNNNEIFSNVIMECDTGIMNCEGTFNSRIYSNDFILNEKQAIDYGGSVWDNDTSGNFWSDYYGYDNDDNGIGDTPYQVGEDIYDRYPLMTGKNIYIPLLSGIADPEAITHEKLSAGDKDQAIIKISLKKSISDSLGLFEWKGLGLTRIGEGSDDDISLVKVYRDVNNSSAVETDVDLLLGKGNFDEGRLTIMFDTGEIITIDPVHFLVTIDVTEQISLEGNTFGIGIKDSSFFKCRFPAKVLNTNFPFFSDEFTLTGVDTHEYPVSYTISQNHPNPFNDVTRISYSIPVSVPVSLKVYDNLGKLVTILIDEVKPAGHYTVEFNGTNLAGGIYYYRLHAGSIVETRKFVVFRF